jgi:hypothetical protein
LRFHIRFAQDDIADMPQLPPVRRFEFASLSIAVPHPWGGKADFEGEVFESAFSENEHKVFSSRRAGEFIAIGHGLPAGFWNKKRTALFNPAVNDGFSSLTD